MFYCSDVRITCSQTLYFLFKVRRTHVTKKRGGFIDHQLKGVGVGEEENRLNLFFFLAGLVLALRAARTHALADVFEKNERKIKQRLCTG